MKYDIENIGKRIAERRKELGLTQDDLADRLSVTPQAISKWERGGGLPDITTLPDIAGTLGFSLDELFGKAEISKPQNFSFPDSFEGLNYVFSKAGVACYSELEAEELSDVFVRFENGSTANLATGEVSYQGPGDIRLIYADQFFQADQSLSDQGIHLEGDSQEAKADTSTEDERLNEADNALEESKTEEEISELAGIDSLNIRSRGRLDIVIGYNPDGILRWGSADFEEIKQHLEVYRTGNTLVFDYKQEDNKRWVFSGLNFGSKNQELRIEFPMKLASRLDCKIMGSGDVSSEIDFEEADILISGAGDGQFQNIDDLKLSISGAGDFIAKDTGKAQVSISGAGDIKLGSIGDSKLSISGAGDAKIGRVEGDLAVKASGACDVDINEGSIGHLDLTINGTGDFSAKNVTCQTANINMTGFGDAVIGRIVGQSKERISRMASLKVLQRG